MIATEEKENFLNTAAFQVPADMERLELPVNTGTLKFWGKFLAEEDNDPQRERLRWAQLKGYRIIDSNPAHDNSLPVKDDFRGMYGKQMWLLYTIGRSDVYHRAGGCRRGGGVLMPAKDIPAKAGDPERLEPCEYCNPRSWRHAPGNAEFSVEITWYTHVPCPTPERLLTALYRDPRCKNCRHKPHDTWQCKCGCDDFAESEPMLSVPGSRLWEKLKAADPDIAAYAQRDIPL